MAIRLIFRKGALFGLLILPKQIDQPATQIDIAHFLKKYRIIQTVCIQEPRASLYINGSYCLLSCFRCYVLHFSKHVFFLHIYAVI